MVLLIEFGMEYLYTYWKSFIIDDDDDEWRYWIIY